MRESETFEVSLCWSVVTVMRQQCSVVGGWVLGSSKAANTARLAVFNLGKSSALSRLLAAAKTNRGYTVRHGVCFDAPWFHAYPAVGRLCSQSPRQLARHLQ
jgi:hypothetical protein